MSQLIDLIGQKYGNLTVIGRAPNRGKHVYWQCKCDCGDIKEIRSQHLREGTIKTCTHCNANSIVGKTFGNWKVLRATDKKFETYILYECKCIKCGNIALKTSTFLKQEHKFCDNCRSNDISNQRFGNLIAIQRMGSDHNHHSIWKCKCDCGNDIIVTYGHLINGDTKSCGCIKSQGEEKIKNILSQNNIIYESQKTFEDCRFPDTNMLARFDFYLPNYNILIEYDGKQHYQYTNSGWNTEENFLKTQNRDKYKNEWCKNNNIKLIRIPYTDFNILNFDYIKKLL